MDISWGMNQTVQWYAQTGERDAYARPILEAKGTVSARVNRKVQMVKNADGVEVVSDTMVHMTDPVQVGDEIIYNGVRRAVISIDDGVSLYGPKSSFYVLYL